MQIRAGELAGQSVEDTEKWYGQIVYIGARKEAGWAQPDVSSVHVGRVVETKLRAKGVCPYILVLRPWK